MRERVFVYAVITIGLTLSMPSRRLPLVGFALLAFVLTEVVNAQRRRRRRAKRA
jgi:hypothetical protein